MGVAAALAGEPGAGIAGGGAGALRELVVLRILLPASVVEAADDDRAADVPFEEIDSTSCPTRGSVLLPQLAPATGMATRTQVPAVWPAKAPVWLSAAGWCR
jgi:hypothetical protein